MGRELVDALDGEWEGPIVFGGRLNDDLGGEVAVDVRPQLRDGLIWDGMLRAQFVEVPGKALSKLDDVIFHRCRLANNNTC